MGDKPSERDRAEASFPPFADDAAVRTIGGLSFENGTERIAIHGALDLTRDRAGLAHAQALARLVQSIVDSLAAQTLSETVDAAARPSRTVANPFA